MKCKFVINSDSGMADKLDTVALMHSLGCNATIERIDSNSNWSAEGFDTVVVCGGDGTLHNAVEKCRHCKLIYVPCGTLNETSCTDNPLRTLGTVNDSLFSYVCATGSFTEIGYSAKNTAKKKWRALAYIPQVFKHYRCHDIAAKADLDGVCIEGHFTLLMVLKGHCCFGFPFNRDYKKTGKNYLLAVNSLGKDCLKNRIKMFFPMFRIFFCGAKPCVRKNWLLLPFDRLTLHLEQPQDFCLDGEKQRLSGKLEFAQKQLDLPIEIVAPRFVNKRIRRPIFD